MNGRQKTDSGFEILDPPRVIGEQVVDESRVWQTAISWIDNNRSLVFRLGGQDSKNIMDPDDLIQQAYIVAYQIVEECLTQGNLEDFVGRFISIFRLSVVFEFLQQSRHRMTFVDEIENFPLYGDMSDCGHLQSPEDNLAAKENETFVNQRVNESLKSMTRRQRQFWNTVFKTPGIQTISDAARVIGVSDNNGRDLFHRSLLRIRRGVC
jgi:hypothetical protein